MCVCVCVCSDNACVSNHLNTHTHTHTHTHTLSPIFPLFTSPPLPPPPQGTSPALVEELSGSRRVFVDKLEEQGRQQAWVLAATHSRHKFTHLSGLMRVILDTLKVGRAG